MPEDKKKSFPMLPIAHWWALRDKFKQSVPGVVTDNYLAAALSMQPKSARANVRPFLRDIELIDKNGKTLPSAIAWRDDGQYAAVCDEMRKKIYPEELIDAVSNPSADRKAVERWFAAHTGSGLAAVRRMAAFYILLSEADFAKKPEKSRRKNSQVRKEKSAPKATKGKPKPPTAPPSPAAPPTPTSLPTPGLNINLEIHISSDATSDQIDKIFESMAKHIYKK